MRLLKAEQYNKAFFQTKDNTKDKEVVPSVDINSLAFSLINKLIFFNYNMTNLLSKLENKSNCNAF